MLQSRKKELMIMIVHNPCNSKECLEFIATKEEMKQLVATKYNIDADNIEDFSKAIKELEEKEEGASFVTSEESDFNKEL